MRILCDTQIVLWAQADDGRLRIEARRLLADPANTILFSMVSLWEVAISARLGRLTTSPEAVYENCLLDDMTLLPLRVEHVAAVARMKDVLHKDPFDHLLIAQAMVENVPMLTADRIVQRYPVQIIKA